MHEGPFFMKQTSNYKQFLLLWAGQLISSIGGGLTSFGLGVYVFQKTGSAGGMALVTLFAFVPTLLFSPLAGVLADRYDRRLSLVIADLSMIGFGLWENITRICCFGFLFFFSLPLANSCLDYLIRTNIDAEKQGRVWGLIGFLTQIGYVIAYGSVGQLADRIAGIRRISVGRGAAQIIMIAGVLLTAAALTIPQMKDIRALEEGVET